ncbi:hypothetical protein GCM10023229_31680 [Flavisolibacter ginsenosidimutans]
MTVQAQDKGKEENSLAVRFAGPSFSQKLPFNNVHFIDCRFDTTKIGYFDKKKKHWKLKPEGGLTNALNQTINSSPKESFSTDANQSLLVVVKKFWMRPPAAEDVRKFMQEGSYTPFWVLTIKLEVYAEQSERYTPLFRVDSTYDVDVFKDGKEIPLDALDDCFTRLQKINVSRIASAKTKLTKDAIDNYNREAFRKPVLQDLSMSRGVFLTFSDFLNKKITYPEFDVELGNEIDNLYIINNSTKELLPNFWGFCDGKNYYIKTGHNFFGLQRSGNSFEFIGALRSTSAYRTPDRPYISNGNSTTAIASGIAGFGLGRLLDREPQFETRPFQVNMETGEVY